MTTPDRPDLERLMHEEWMHHQEENKRENALREEGEKAKQEAAIEDRDVSGTPLERFLDEYEIDLCKQLLAKVELARKREHGKRTSRQFRNLVEVSIRRYVDKTEPKPGVLGKILGIQRTTQIPLLRTRGYLLGVATKSDSLFAPRPDNILDANLARSDDPVLKAASSRGKVMGMAARHGTIDFAPVYLCEDRRLRTSNGHNIKAEYADFFAARKFTFTRVVEEYKGSRTVSETTYIHIPLPDLLALTAVHDLSNPADFNRPRS